MDFFDIGKKIKRKVIFTTFIPDSFPTGYYYLLQSSNNAECLCVSVPKVHTNRLSDMESFYVSWEGLNRQADKQPTTYSY